MSNEERYQEYIKEHCENCSNSETDLCEIRVFACGNTIYTRCKYYANKNPIKNKKKPIQWQNW